MVGCGDIAGGFDTDHAGPEVLTHARAYLEHGGFELRACVEPGDERRRAFMQHWGVEHGFADLAACRAAGLAFDVASLCAPTPAHAEILDQLLEMPVKAVFCEKPLTADAAASRRLVDAYEAAGRPLAVNYFRRWDASMIALGRAIAAGEWGGVQSVAGHYAKGLLNCGSHLIDLLHFLIGPLSPEAVLHRRFDFTPDDPTLDVLLRTADGAPVYLIGSDSRQFFSFEIDITFENGRVVIEDLGRTMRSRPVAVHPVFPSRRALERGEWTETGFASALVDAVANLQEHICDGTPLLSDGRSALAAQELCAALVHMAE